MEGWRKVPKGDGRPKGLSESCTYHTNTENLLPGTISCLHVAHPYRNLLRPRNLLPLLPGYLASNRRSRALPANHAVCFFRRVGDPSKLRADAGLNLPRKSGVTHRWLGRLHSICPNPVPSPGLVVNFQNLPLSPRTLRVYGAARNPPQKYPKRRRPWQASLFYHDQSHPLGGLEGNNHIF